MLPRKTPRYLLPIVWVVGTIPYVLFTFWLKDLAAPYPWALKTGELISGFSAAFSTAFPFWWIIEWFANRNKKHENASLQLDFLNNTAQLFNVYLGRMLYDPSSLLSKKASKDYLHQWTKEQIDQELDKSVTPPTVPLELRPSKMLNRIKFAGFLFNALNRRRDLFELYAHQIPFEFTRDVGEMMAFYQGSISDLAETTDDTSLEMDFSRSKSAILDLRDRILLLENNYRSFYGLEVIITPADHPSLKDQSPALKS